MTRLNPQQPTPFPRTKHLIMALCTFDEGGIISAIKGKLNPNAKRGWVLCGYNGANIVLQKSGDGDTAELVKNLVDDQVQYALIRLPDKKDGTDTIRDVLVCWTGPGVKKIEAARKKTHLGAVRGVIKPSHAEVEAISRANFTEVTLYDRSHPLSGSHVID